MAERRYALAAGKDFLSPHTTHGELTAAEIVARLRKFAVIDLTQAEYAALPVREKAAWKKQSGFIIGGNFQGRKKASDCLYRSLVTLDLDALTPSSMTSCVSILTTLKLSGVLYSTASHTPSSPRMRAVIFLKEDVPPQKYRNLVTYFAGILPTGSVSTESYVISQIMYRPQRCKDGEEVFIELSGEPFDGLSVPDQTPELPDRPSTSAKAWEVHGIVGRVGARYEGDLDRAIAELDLPYQRSTSGATCGEFEDRYTYTKGAGADGAVWYRNDGHLWSHHGTDPANGENATIFDLVRLHRFNPENDDVSLPISERASHRAAEAYFLATFPDLAPAAPSIDELEDVIPEPPRVANPGRFAVIRPENFTRRPRPTWIVKGVMPKAQLAILYGASGSGKSFIALDISAAIARGVAWRGHKTPKANVVYLAAEAAQGFQLRMESYVKENAKHGVTMADMPAVIPEAPNLLELADVQDLTASLRQYGPVDVLVVDTLAATMPGGNENESAAVGRLISHLKAISDALGCMILLIHHSGKDATKGARGWSGLRAAADAEFELTRSGELRVLTQTKSKDGIDGRQWGFRLGIVELGLDEDNEPITSCVCEEAQLVSHAGDLTEFQELLKQVVVTANANGVTDEGVVKKRARTFFCEHYGTTAEGTNNKRVNRAWTELVDLGVIHLHDGGTKVTTTPVDTATAEEFE